MKSANNWWELTLISSVPWDEIRTEAIAIAEVIVRNIRDSGYEVPISNRKKV